MQEAQENAEQRPAAESGNSVCEVEEQECDGAEDGDLGFGGDDDGAERDASGWERKSQM